MNFENDLAKRLFWFSVNVIKFLKLLPEKSEYRVIKYQLTKSATSSGANYKEAQSGFSKSDFHYKVSISLKEMSESNYWLNIINEIADFEIELKELNCLIDESRELERILGSIVMKTKK
jgi:four helix bundle protein